jgi:heat shock protein HslJ
MDDKNVNIDSEQVVLTRMTCPDSKTEKSFLLALKETAYWQIKGDHFELLNESSKVLARFEAVFFKKRIYLLR